MDSFHLPPYPLADILFFQGIVGFIGATICAYAITGSGFTILVKPSVNHLRRYGYLMFGLIVLVALPVWSIAEAGWQACMQALGWYWRSGDMWFRLDVISWWPAIFAVPLAIFGGLWIRFWPNRIQRRVNRHARQLYRNRV